jgi:hypothetical protein
VTAPFAWRYDEYTGGRRVAPEPAPVSLATLNRKRVVQCALSRICGSCAEGLGRPIAFVGTTREVGRNAFHFPPMHLTCARGLAAELPGTEVVTTSGFEFVRPGREDDDDRPTFQPNSLLSEPTPAADRAG